MSSQGTRLATAGVPTGFQADWLLGTHLGLLLPPFPRDSEGCSWSQVPGPTPQSPCRLQNPGDLESPQPQSPESAPSHPTMAQSETLYRTRRCRFGEAPSWGPATTVSGAPRRTGDHTLGLTLHGGKCTHHARVRAAEAGHMELLAEPEKEQVSAHSCQGIWGALTPSLCKGKAPTGLQNSPSAHQGTQWTLSNSKYTKSKGWETGRWSLPKARGQGSPVPPQP